MSKDVKVIGIPHRIGNTWVYEFISNFNDREWMTTKPYPIEFSLSRNAYNISEDVVPKEYRKGGCM